MIKILKFYHRWKDLGTIIGYFVMLSSVLSGLWVGFSFIQQANANTTAIGELQTWKNDTSIAFVRFEQKLDDIHEAVVKK